MSKTNKKDLYSEETIAFDMIELTCEGLQDLTRAFEVIDTVCRELNGLPMIEMPWEEIVH